MTTKEILDTAEACLEALGGYVFDDLTVSKPASPAAALNLAKIVSKLSALMGNLIEFNFVQLLNSQPGFMSAGKWERQDPGFPDAVFRGEVEPIPGFEIKAWFPLSTEVTARFKDSQNTFASGNIRVVVVAWLPEHLIYGRPKIIDVCVVDGGSVAAARDLHYHVPPKYVVIEPEDTSDRTRNLQQSNTSGYVWQGGTNTPQFESAKTLVEGWGPYQPSTGYQAQVRELMSKYKYRLDTNYAKIDRIEHDEIEKFKTRVLGTLANGMTIQQWARLFQNGTDAEIREALSTHCFITEAEAPDSVG